MCIRDSVDLPHGTASLLNWIRGGGGCSLRFLELEAYMDMAVGFLTLLELLRRQVTQQGRRLFWLELLRLLVT